MPLAELAGVGIGVPGLVDPATGDRRARGQPRHRGAASRSAPLLAERLGGVRVRVDNDLNVAAVGAAHGARTPRRDLAFLALGTGVAAGLLLDGEPAPRRARRRRGDRAPDPRPDGLPCTCGQRGCLELYASGSALDAALAAAVRRPAPRPSCSPPRRPGDAARGRDPRRVRGAVAAAVRVLVLTCDVERVVIGGGVREVGEPLLEAVADAARARRRRARRSCAAWGSPSGCGSCAPRRAGRRDRRGAHVRGLVRPAAGRTAEPMEVVDRDRPRPGPRRRRGRRREAAAAQPDAVLGLATGSSPLAVLRRAGPPARRAGELSFARVRGVHARRVRRASPPTTRERYRNVIETEIASRVRLRARRGAGPGRAAPRTSSRRAPPTRRRSPPPGGVDLQLLGIGTDGHIALQRAGLVARVAHPDQDPHAPDARADNARFFGGDVDQVPQHCLTQGLGDDHGGRGTWCCSPPAAARPRRSHQLVEGPVSAHVAGDDPAAPPARDGAGRRRRREPPPAGRLLPLDLGEQALAGTGRPSAQTARDRPVRRAARRRPRHSPARGGRAGRRARGPARAWRSAR